MTIEAAVRRHHDRISLEANHLADLKDLIQNAMPDFNHYLTRIQASFANGFSKQADLAIVQQIIMKELRASYKAQHLDFLTYGENLISVPENFKGKYIDYADDLIKALNVCHNRIVSILGQVNSYLATFITNKDQQLTLKDRSKIFKEIENERTDINKALAKYFPLHSGVTKAEIQSVLYRFQDLKELRKKVSDIDTTLGRFKLNELQSKIQETVDLAGMIIQSFKNDEIKAVSPMAAKAISNGLYETAQYIEFTSVLYFDATVFLNAVDKLYETILNA